MKFLSDRYAYKHGIKRIAAFLFDCVGSLLFIFSHKPSSDLRGKTFRKILVIRNDQIGDVLMTLPAILSLREKFPQAEIHVAAATPAAGFLKHVSQIDKVIEWKHAWFDVRSRVRQKLQSARVLYSTLKPEGYDLAIDFRGDLRNIFLMALLGIPVRLGYGLTGGSFLLTRRMEYPANLHQVKANLKLLEPLGISSEVRQQPLEFSADKIQEFWTRQKIRHEENRKLRVIIHAEAGYPSKRWPLESFRQLIHLITLSRAADIFLIGQEPQVCSLDDIIGQSEGVVDLRGKTMLTDLAILFEDCDLYIGNDSGPAHLAAYQGAELIVLFSGANESDLWHPWSNRLHLMEHRVPCSPCHSRVCPLGHHDCMKNITVGEVFAEVCEIMKSSAQRLRKTGTGDLVR